jgi:hypothetical protein
MTTTTDRTAFEDMIRENPDDPTTRLVSHTAAIYKSVDFDMMGAGEC